MKPIPYVSTYIRRVKETSEGPPQKGDIFQVIDWTDRGEPIIQIPGINKKRWSCEPSYWEDYSFTKNLKKILE